MKISIDCRMINSSGVGAYLKGCLPYFLKTQNSFLLIGDERGLSEFADKPDINIFDCSIKPFSAVETFFPPAALYKAINKTDLYYSPYFNIPARVDIPVYATIHDIIFPDMPELCSRAGLAARMWFYRRAFKLSEKVFTVSQFSKDRIEHYLGNTKPVIVTYSAAKYPRRYNLGLYAEKQWGKILDKPYILFVGNIKKHKGLFCLLEAFFEARKQGLNYKLIIAGEKNNFRTSDGGALEKLIEQNGEYVLFTGLVSDNELEILFEKAALLVQPSLYEGFGLPPLEALVRGTPALISDIAVFKEVYKSYPVMYFRAGSSACLKDKLLELLRRGAPPRIILSGDVKSTYTFEKTARTIMQGLAQRALAR
ncbi:MAG: glycosyltransferase family 4 protein [Spirochaetaceae bacterium]|jgi:glycosyltransferase involved in cell wall biosynthesis|nr:glycosyltransferase family 4 protein [Spirochaetaceae bacterium]